MEEKRITHYRSFHDILLVGEKDSSFSLCLARAFGPAVNMVATSLDSRASLMMKYGSVLRNLTELEALGCTIVHEVNVHTMAGHPVLLKHRYFDRIIFNFSHAGFVGRERDTYQIEFHKELMRGFLKNVKCMLSYIPHGEIHITHKTKHPYKMWDIKMLPNCENLVLVGEKDLINIFNQVTIIRDRGDGLRCDQSFIVGECSIFMFKRQSIF